MLVRPQPKQITGFVIGVIAIVYLTDFELGRFNAGLDNSWIAVMAWAAAKPLQFGPDIVFTNGPLGYLLYPINFPAVYWPALFLRLAANILLVAMLFVLSGRLPPWRGIALFLTTLLGAYYTQQTIYLFMILVGGWIIFFQRDQKRSLQVASLIFFALAVLMKGTLLSLAAAVMLIGATWLIWRREWWRLLLTTCCFTAALLIAWMFAGQSFVNIGSYLWSMIQIMAGYGPVATLRPPNGILAAGAVAFVLGITQVAICLREKPNDQRAWFVSAMLAVTWFLLWKISFTRADVHTVQLFYYGIPAVLALPAFYEESFSGRSRYVDWIAILVLAASGIYVVHDRKKLTVNAIAGEAVARVRSSVAGFLAPLNAHAKAEAAYNFAAAKLALPQIANAVGRESVDVFGHEQAVALANGFNYTPRPAVQSYAAFSAPFIKADAEFYRSARAPHYVLFKLQTMDGHLPSSDDAEALLVLANDYTPVLSEKGFILLRRRPEAPAKIEMKPIRSGVARFGDVIPVPNGAVWCELRIRPTVPGKLLGLVYQQPQIFAVIQGSAAVLPAQRLIPGPAANGFVINPLLQSATDFTNFAAGNPQQSQTRAVQLLKPRGGKWLTHTRFWYRFSEIVPADRGGEWTPP
ncbi:MAG: hypothetical protein ACJ8M1_06485 [Chthoniobacterales bacterium]